MFLDCGSSVGAGAPRSMPALAVRFPSMSGAFCVSLEVAGVSLSDARPDTGVSGRSTAPPPVPVATVLRSR